ncbi:MAG: ATP-binding cassette domain-containing protein [Firmicutes bacterium]|nr:ATP-binding cassette domain-containing protein [Bacillota bacterium]
MAQIVVHNLHKTFKVARRHAGLRQAVRGLFKRDYTLIRALDGISFEIQEGELVGYLGPNGAGKSTTIKILSGILVPDGGVCRVMGRVPWQERVAHVRELGVVFGQRSQLWWDLPVIDSFELLRDIYQLSPGDYHTVLTELADILQLDGLIDTPVRQLSLGQRMRCELAAALLHRPRILFLDEPTIGLDAVSRLMVRDFIGRLNREKGTTVILTTHDLDDVEALCSRVMVIGKGKILIDGSLQEIRRQVAHERRLVVELDGSYPAEALARQVSGAQLVKLEGRQAHFSFEPDKITPVELLTKLAAIFEIRDVLIEDPPIDEVISRLYGELQI